jgi:rubrerythrin
MKTQGHIEITNKEKEQLIKAQQGELDAVILYRKLSETVRKTNVKETLLKIAADEGKHAGILRKYTGEDLKPKNFKALIVTSIYKVFGLKFTFKLLEKGELKAAKEYATLVEKFPNIKQIIRDEELHGNLMGKLL